MIFKFALPEHERKLIPEGRFSSSMPWIIAIMSFLTVLAAAAGLIIFEGTRTGGDELSRRVTVQIIEANPDMRIRQRDAVAQSLKNTDGIDAVDIVSDEEIRSLLTPWLGNDVVDADIPIPALVEILLDEPANEARLASLRALAIKSAPSAKLDSQADWMRPYFSLMNSMLLLTGGILFLLLLATSASVVLAVRSALNTHRETLHIMHMMGGTDIQSSRLFERRMALDTLLGGLIGFVLAAVVIWLLSMRFAAVGSSLMAGASLPWYGWIILALIPLAIMGLAMLVARNTVLSALKNIL